MRWLLLLSATGTSDAGVEVVGEVVVVVLWCLLLPLTSTRSTAVLVLVVLFAPLLDVMLAVTPVPGSVSCHDLQVDSYREEQRRLVWLCAAVRMSFIVR